MVVFSSDNKDAFYRKSLDNRLFCVVHTARVAVLHMFKGLLSRKLLSIGSPLTRKQIFPTGMTTKVHMFHLTFSAPRRKTSTVFPEPSISPSGFELWTKKARKILTERGVEKLTLIFKLGRMNSFIK